MTAEACDYEQVDLELTGKLRKRITSKYRKEGWELVSIHVRVEEPNPGVFCLYKRPIDMSEWSEMLP